MSSLLTFSDFTTAIRSMISLNSSRYLAAKEKIFEFKNRKLNIVSNVFFKTGVLPILKKSNKDGKKDTKHCYSDVDAGRKTIRRMCFAYIDLKIPKDAQ